MDFQFGIFTNTGLEVFSLLSVPADMFSGKLLQRYNMYELVGGTPKHCFSEAWRISGESGKE